MLQLRRADFVSITPKTNVGVGIHNRSSIALSLVKLEQQSLLASLIVNRNIHEHTEPKDTLCASVSADTIHYIARWFLVLFTDTSAVTSHSNNQ
jgi:hypothetical protein